MEFISVFDIFKIGVGPSSSHTLGPWKAAAQFVSRCIKNHYLNDSCTIQVSLYGSLSLTGKGHGTDLAIIMGLCGYNPETVDTGNIEAIVQNIRDTKILLVNGDIHIPFDVDHHIIFEKDFLPFHANGMLFRVMQSNGDVYSEVYYSVGGGFIIREGETTSDLSNQTAHPYPIQNSLELLEYCNQTNNSISEIVIANELMDRSETEIHNKLLSIWDIMLQCMYIGCHSNGYLPGPLNVKRRAAEVTGKLLNNKEYVDKEGWLNSIKAHDAGFQEVLKWVGSFAIGVNEVNASFGRVVTAPTNGSAGVIPAVLLYYLCFVNKKAGQDEIVRYLCTAGEIGSIFKKGSTISAAMGGCQAEIGVSSAMAAAGLTELLGGTPEQCTIAAEVAMEHHLGMTCDPIGGLVQVPCIERNSMGAIKAINAASMAIDRNPMDIIVPLDNVIQTMWETAKDMNRKYKETSEGGLATAVNIIDC
ncbi:MAG: L-serine ammonia-lyase [Saprospiraceae bacterium]|nr:L-serine ammonia-lyase [Saprospiraceae bacterium]